LPRLLDEVRGAVDGPADEAPTVALADTIYRRFFKAGILLVLSLGAVWGAYLLLRIGFTGNFRSAGLHEINAHGHAQILGWVGLFVMGFAYQVFPRLKHTNLAYPSVAVLSFLLMLTGIVLRAFGEPLAAVHPWLLPVVVVASLMEIVAIALFVG